MCFLCILIPILVGLIAALLGYLLGRLLNKSAKVDNSGLQDRIKMLEGELEACQSKSKTYMAEIEQLKSGAVNKAMNLSAPIAAAIPFDADAAAAVFGKKIKKDDLKIVEGIGPKIEELFHSLGIKTWKALSETTVDECRAILSKGGERFTVHEPGTWPKQSLMAYEGRWQELKDWQDVLDGGKE
ncbi:MAG: hypothetical protein CSA36_04680 [Draconibacterium sp.]|nr:MAG: hypothetical protein CSA36_04680 [Draconibacterium sp.]